MSRAATCSALRDRRTTSPPAVLDRGEHLVDVAFLRDEGDRRPGGCEVAVQLPAEQLWLVVEFGWPTGLGSDDRSEHHSRREAGRTEEGSEGGAAEEAFGRPSIRVGRRAARAPPARPSGHPRRREGLGRRAHGDSVRWPADDLDLVTGGDFALAQNAGRHREGSRRAAGRPVDRLFPVAVREL
jgi:hypothetical protein